jgi:Ca-activated chloride channel homolog
MTIYRLGNPWALFLLIFPLLVLLTLIVSRFIFKKGVKITGVSNFGKFLSMATLGYYFSLALSLFGLFIIAFSLTKPQHGIKREKIISEGIDIIIALDTSGSMTIRDFYQQSRIEGAKNIIMKFIDNRKGDKIGLVTFGFSSLLKCPATLNFNLLKSVIKRIYIDPNREFSSKTAIGIGLASAVNRLVNSDIQEKQRNSKIIILVTDGANNAGEISPQAATEIAAKLGIKIYTVGLGDRQDVDLELLKYIADKTNGVFFQARNSGELGPIFEEINKLEKHKIETMEYSRFNNVGYKFAFAGIFSLMLGLLSNILFFKRLA